MAQVRDWNEMRDMWIRLLGQRTRQSLGRWNQLMSSHDFKGKDALLGRTKRNGLRAILVDLGTIRLPEILLGQRGRTCGCPI
jgi:hypothetical protein